MSWGVGTKGRYGVDQHICPLWTGAEELPMSLLVVSAARVHCGHRTATLLAVPPI